MDMKSLLKKIVETESPSHDREAVSRVGALVAGEARRLGAQVEIINNQETGDHVISRWRDCWDGILLLGHMVPLFPL